jgi:tRNA-Thr(GGU) m(6)t(6)A37 methyltransferase TsaA
MKKSLVIACGVVVLVIIVGITIRALADDPCCPINLSAASQEVKNEAAHYLVSLGTVQRQAGRTFLVLKERYAPGLVSLEDYSHVMVFYWFDQNDTPEKRAFLQGYREGKEKPLTGVFATRAPMRPNLIGFTTCKIISIKENVVEIKYIDAFDNSPVLDLKPYIPRNDSHPEAQIPVWVR